MNKNIFLVSILVTGILVASMMAKLVVAQTDGQVTPEISYPVAELGNCADKTACKAYCDKSENIDACLSFAEKNGIMSKEEVKTAKNFKKSGMVGPGGCKGKDECKTYCNGPDHMDECITFAEKNGMMSSKQLEEAKKVKSAIAKGIKPPACGGKEACDAYCSSSEHIEECVNFGEAAGMISKEDAEKIKKGPGKGQGKDQQGKGGPGGGDNGNLGGPEGKDGKGSDQGQGGQGQGGGGKEGQGPGGPGGPGGQGDEQGQGQGKGPNQGQGGQGQGGGGKEGQGQGGGQGKGQGGGQGQGGGR